MRVGPLGRLSAWRIDAFELRCWRRLLRVPWAARRSNQTVLKEIKPKCSLEGLMLKLKLQYFGRLMQRANSLEKTLMLGKIEGRRRRECHRMRWWMASPTRWTWVWASSGVVDGQGGLVYCSPWGHKESDRTEWLNNNNLFILNFDSAGPSVLRGLSSSCSKWGLLSSCSTQASHCGGCSCCGAWLYSCGTQTWLLHSVWDLPRSGIESVSLTLAGEFFTTEPPSGYFMRTKQRISGNHKKSY